MSQGARRASTALGAVEFALPWWRAVACIQQLAQTLQRRAHPKSNQQFVTTTAQGAAKQGATVNGARCADVSGKACVGLRSAAVTSSGSSGYAIAGAPAAPIALAKVRRFGILSVVREA